MEEFQAFRKYQALSRKMEEKGKQKENTKADSDNVSVHTCHTDDSQEDNEEINRAEPKKVKEKRNKGGTNLKGHPLNPGILKYQQAMQTLNFRSPFTDEINETPIPPGLKGPRVKPYDGTGDPDDHVSNFHWAIKMIPMDPNLWSLYFAGTLDGSARYWLASLPAKSIGSFDELCAKFCNSFIQQRRFQQQAHAIFACRQREGESNKAYFRRFNEISRSMPTRDDPMIIAAFTYGLLEGELFRKLVGKEFSNAEEMIRKINRFLRQEAESAEKAKMEGRGVGTMNRKGTPVGTGRNHTTENQQRFGRYPRFGHRGRERPND